MRANAEAELHTQAYVNQQVHVGELLPCAAPTKSHVDDRDRREMLFHIDPQPHNAAANEECAALAFRGAVISSERLHVVVILEVMVDWQHANGVWDLERRRAELSSEDEPAADDLLRHMSSVTGCRQRIPSGLVFFISVVGTHLIHEKSG